MFESAELKHKLSDKDYDTEVPGLREALLDAQFDLLEKKDRSLLIIVGGVEGAGKGDTINLLSSWLDPRYLDIHALPPHSDEERARPAHWPDLRTPPSEVIGTRRTIGFPALARTISFPALASSTRRDNCVFAA